jgi:hypothetical protein
MSTQKPVGVDVWRTKKAFVSKSVTLTKGVYGGFLPVNKKSEVVNPSPQQSKGKRTEAL